MTTTTPTITSTHSTRHFFRHYVEMVVAMVVGMAALGMPADALTSALGFKHSQSAMLLSMATTMTLGMVAWMRYRGHGWRANLEMAASMFIPAFAAIALRAAGA